MKNGASSRRLRQELVESGHSCVGDAFTLTLTLSLRERAGGRTVDRFEGYR